MRLIDADAVIEKLFDDTKHNPFHAPFKLCTADRSDVKFLLHGEPTVDAVPVVHGWHEGDVCIYGFGHENKSRAIVEIVRILNDERGVAEVKFHKVFVDDTGNGFFNFLLKSGNTMNASFQYLKNITPRMDGE